MKILVNAPFQVTDQMQEVIDDKVGKLETYFDRIAEAEIYLKIGEKRHRHREQIAEIRLNVPGTTLFAADRSDSIEKAVAGASEKARKQLIRFKKQLPGNMHH